MRQSLFFILALFFTGKLLAQQDVAFQVNQHFFPGKNIISVKRDFFDPYLWVLAENNSVYRINSVTMAVDDYSAAFAGQSALKFIDIAGVDKDIVFIATNSNNLIQYKDGSIKTLGTTAGIVTTINSIGVAKRTHQYYDSTPADPPVLLIGSDEALYRYDVDNEILTRDPGEHNSKIYSATFRTEMFRDSTRYDDFDGSRRLPAFYAGEYTSFVGYLWEGKNGFGDHIKTATMVTGAMTDYDIRVQFMNMFWGNKNGLFQNNWQFSYNLEHDYGHYLDGISVNKVTTIYGLTAFGGGAWFDYPGKMKQNLLIGTDQGLYFSNSVYRKGVLGLTTFELFHADILGSIKVNDICVNVASVETPLCEDGAWVATEKGLYYLKPDYAQYLPTTQLQATSFKDAPADQQHLDICAGNTATALVATNSYTGNSIQWYKDGQQLPGESGRELQISTAGEYYAILYDPCQDIHLETNHLTTSIISAPVFSFNYPETLALCDVNSTTLATDYSPAYQYRWLKDGVLTGDVSYSINVQSNGKYKVEVSACDGNWVSSKEVNVALINLPAPSIVADKTTYCEGETARLSLNIQSGPDYRINWLLNGQIVPSLQDKTSITSTADSKYTVELSSVVGICTKTSDPLEIKFVKTPVFSLDHSGTVYLCEDEALTLQATANTQYQYRWYKNGQLTANTGASVRVNEPGIYYAEASACENSWVPSATVDVKVISFTDLRISQYKAAYCKGDKASLSIKVSATDNYDISWQRDGAVVPDFAGQAEIMTDIPGNYQAMVSSRAKPDCIKPSPVYALVFHDPPVAKITKTIKTSLCDGEAVVLNVDNNVGTVLWSTAETTASITVRHSGKYSVRVTSPAGCTADDNIDVLMLPNPVLDVPDTSVCTFTHSSVTLTAPGGFTKYIWNGVEGSRSFSVTMPQTVTLTVEDSNGCKASQDIVVASDCPDVKMGNTFTPNNDGVNDTWTISGIANDPTVQLNIYNRNGQEVYKSHGYYTPWDGRYHGKLLPPATYYYVLFTKQHSQKSSGWVSILY